MRSGLLEYVISTCQEARERERERELREKNIRDKNKRGEKQGDNFDATLQINKSRGSNRVVGRVEDLSRYQLYVHGATELHVSVRSLIA